ncbi:MAG TPA: hypothetical protein VGH40_10675 [Roseiarcus sp.]|jgi:hypothetical protein
MATDYDYALNPPRPARQNNLDTCWACCMSALLESNLSVKRASESELVKQYASTPTGGVSIAQLPVIATDFGYLCNAFQDVPAARATMTDRFIVDRLRTNGMLMAAWRVRDPAKPNETFFHAQIVWGVTYLTNQDIGSERAMLRTMNPWSARYELYPLFSVYRSDNMPMFTCWPKTSRP